jgi:hypothetical protein
LLFFFEFFTQDFFIDFATAFLLHPIAFVRFVYYLIVIFLQQLVIEFAPF